MSLQRKVSDLMHRELEMSAALREARSNSSSVLKQCLVRTKQRFEAQVQVRAATWRSRHAHPTSPTDAQSLTEERDLLASKLDDAEAEHERAVKTHKQEVRSPTCPLYHTPPHAADVLRWTPCNSPWRTQ